jgi:hypothetical protein
MKIPAMQKALKKLNAPKFYDLALTRMDEINAERKRYTKNVLEEHFSDNILPILALYLVLKESGREDAFQFSEKVAYEIFDTGRKRMEFLGRFPFFYTLIQKNIHSFMAKAFPAEGWEIEWLEVSEKQVAFNMHGCFYHQALSDYNAPELTPVFCNLDDLIYENASPHLTWARSGTIGRGDAHCDFRFINAKNL